MNGCAEITEASAMLVCARGLPLREAFEVARLARRHVADITLSYDGFHADAKSLWEILKLDVLPGGEVTLEAVGSDAPQVKERMQSLFAGFGSPVFQPEPARTA